jgi:hypothetical protein
LRSVDRGRCRPGIEPRNPYIGVPTPCNEAEGEAVGSVMRVANRPRVVRDPVHAPKHLAREPGGPMTGQGKERRPGPRRKPGRGNPTTNGRGKSDRPIVPKKPANKAGGAPLAAERVEERGLAKGNPSQRNKGRTQRREALQSKLERVRQAEKRLRV